MINTKHSRHKWNGKIKGQMAVACIKCGCVKEQVKSGIIYFINDTFYHNSPTCHQDILQKKPKTH